MNADDVMTIKGFIIAPVLLHPKSIGEITLQSADPRAPPIIDPHYLEHPHDVKVLIEVILLILQLFTTPSQKRTKHCYRKQTKHKTL